MKQNYTIAAPALYYPSIYKPQEINGNERFSIAWRERGELIRAQTRIRPLLLPDIDNEGNREDLVRVFEHAQAMNLPMDQILWEVPAEITCQEFEFHAPGGESGKAHGLVALRVNVAELDKGLNRAINRRLEAH